MCVCVCAHVVITEVVVVSNSLLSWDKSNVGRLGLTVSAYSGDTHALDSDQMTGNSTHLCVYINCITMHLIELTVA